MPFPITEMQETLLPFPIMDMMKSLFRWIHVVAGILWIGLLYWFNWVNSAWGPTLDAETKKKVLPEVLPRTLYWFRWAAAFTWIFGVFLLIIHYWTDPWLLTAPEEIDAFDEENEITETGSGNADEVNLALRSHVFSIFYV